MFAQKRQDTILQIVKEKEITTVKELKEIQDNLNKSSVGKVLKKK